MINGVAVFSHNLAVGLAKRGHEVLVICPSQTGHNYNRTIDGVKTVYLKSVDAKVYPDLIMVCQELEKMGQYSQLDYENGLSFFLNNVRLTTADQKKRYCDLVKQLVNLIPDDLPYLINGHFVDSSGDDARLMTIEDDGKNLVIKVAEIL